MKLGAWWAAHFRPRDAYALLALVALVALSAFVWMAGGPDRKDVVVYALGVVAGVGGFYSGAHVADRAADRAGEERRELRDLLSERDAALEQAPCLSAELRQQVRALSDLEDAE